MTLRGVMDQLVKNLSHALIATTPEARDFAVAMCEEELARFIMLLIAQAAQKGREPSLITDTSDASYGKKG